MSDKYKLMCDFIGQLPEKVRAEFKISSNNFISLDVYDERETDNWRDWGHIFLPLPTDYFMLQDILSHIQYMLKHNKISWFNEK